MPETVDLARRARLSRAGRDQRRSGTLHEVEVDFVVRPDGIIEAHVEPRGGLLDEALNDAISSRAPRGAVHQGLSTYWIDRTEALARRNAENQVSDPFASGNVTYLRLDGDRVVAGYDFDRDEENADALTFEEFLDLLSAWRERVTEAGGVSGPEAAEMVEAERVWPLGPGK